MSEIQLVQPTAADAEKILAYRAEFPARRERVTLDPRRIPGLDHLEEFSSVKDWLQFCASMAGKITWYMTVRQSDGRVVGFLCFRHRLEYDDDDIEFASHLGYSIRPSERRRGYAAEQLRLGLEKAKECGLDRVRLVCRDSNIGSKKAILANGGVYVDTIRGEESGLAIERYDLRTS